MIGDWDKWLKFIEESSQDDLLLHVIPLHSGIHSATNSPSLLFIRNLDKKKTYCYSFDHPDMPSAAQYELVIKTLNGLTGKKWVVDKKSFSHMIPLTGTYDIGVAEYLRDNKVFDINDFDTSAHMIVKRNFGRTPGYGRFVPLLKHLEAFSDMVEVCEKIIAKTQVDEAFKNFNEFIIDPLAETEMAGLAIDPLVFREHFGDIFVKSGKAYTQYNVYTATGRPSNRFGGVNYAALNKEDGSRKSFISRFGNNGKLVLIDYSAFHPRIIAKLANYSLKPDVDIYEYLAKLYFNKSDIDEGDILDAKKITFRQLYGGVEEKYRHIKYLSHLKEYIDYQWKFFNEHRYVETPFFKRRITDKHLSKAKPATVFNYLLQAAEGEISIPVLGSINAFLREKKTKAILYTYDSILFDYCYEDGAIMNEVKSLMSLDNTFPMKWYMGDNFHEMELIEA